MEKTITLVNDSGNAYTSVQPYEVEEYIGRGWKVFNPEEKAPKAQKSAKAK